MLQNDLKIVINAFSSHILSDGKLDFSSQYVRESFLL